ncbi:protein yellow [Pieris rapae]|uniref:protein yellow n=1 Tax=Pieris rapae TaxID=64459 RepID=UPI001E27B4DE|nr:protein yellow [Pieris rapae]
MAVSHQWFIQWSSPLVFADINTQYKNVNHFDKRDFNTYSYRNNDHLRSPYIYREQKNLKREKSQYAGVTLWLAMLGLASPQSLPADLDTPPFSTLYKWKYADFEFPSEGHRRQAISLGKFIPENVLPLGLEIWGSRVWVTIPSWKQGVPATLATVPRSGGVVSPRLVPYPDWSYHRAFISDQDPCSGLTSVFRISIDQCGRLWVLDSGQIDSTDSPKQICPPTIVVFDLNTDTLLARYKIPEKYVLQDSLFSNIIVDSRSPDCSDLHVYITDTWRFGLLVFRERDSEFWRFSHHLFYPDPLASNFTLHGLNFQWSDGIFGLALTPINYYSERILYFHAMSSYREFSVKTSVLRDSSRVNSSATEFNLVGDSRGIYGQSSASAIDKNGVMFYGLVTRDSIGCWDTKKPYHKSTTGVVATNAETLIFPNDVKVDQEERQSVWVISNKLPMFQNAPLDSNDYNYRIMYADTGDAIRGTICDPNLTPAQIPFFHSGPVLK